MLATLMVFTMLPGGMLRASAAGTLNITQTDGTGGYTQDGNGNIVIQADGSYTISGSSTTGGVSVESGVTANITLGGVSINVSNSNFNQKAFSIASGASVTLTLKGNNTLTSGTYYAGLSVPSGASVTITGTDSDSLTASSDDGTTNDPDYISDINDGYGAGIGGSVGSKDCGNVTIKGGNITAIGGNGEAHRTSSSYTASKGGSAGIGGADGLEMPGGKGGTVLITGGTVTAKGGAYSSGIGGGSASNGGDNIGGDGGDVTVTGGTVTATCRNAYDTGIGGGCGIYGGKGGTVNISGGTVNATTISAGSGYNVTDYWGEEWGGEGGTVNISGGTVNTARIGGGISSWHPGKSATVTINGGNVHVNDFCDVTDGHGNSVYQTILTLPSASTTPVSSLSITQGSSVTYGINDLKTDGSGKMFLYLPASSATTAVLTAGGATYSNYHGTVDTGNSGVLKMDQSALTITGISSSYTYKDSILPFITGGNGTGNVTYTYTGTDNITGQSYSSTSAPTDAGSYSVIAQKAGDDAYYPSKISPAVNFVITKKSLSSYTLALDKNVYLRTGSEIKPGVTVRDSGGNTLDPSNYSVNYVNNTAIASSVDADPPTVTVSGEGNYTGSLSAAFTIESAPSINVTGNTKDWTASATVTATVTVGNSGIGSVTVDDGSGNQTALTGGTLAATSSTDETSTYTYTYSAMKNGTYTFTVTDGSGYTSSQSLTFTNIDTDAPTNMKISVAQNAFTTLLTHITFGLFFNNTVNVILSATDAKSDIDHYEYQIVPLNKISDVQPGSTWISSSDGKFSISSPFMSVIFARAMDKAGNYSAIVSSTGVVIDKSTPTAPAIQAMIGGESYGGSWVPWTVKITASNSSAFSGIDRYEYKIGESGTWTVMPSRTGINDAISGKPPQDVLNISTNMEDTVYVRAVSNSQIAGSESAVTVKRDNVMPVINVGVTGTTGQWTDKSVIFTLSDIADNIAPVSYQVKIGTDDWADVSGNTITVNEDTDTIYQFRAISDSGKTSDASGVYTVKIDKTSPIITDVIESTTDWTTGDVTLTVHAEDGGSGLYQYSFDGGQSWQGSPSSTYTANKTVALGTVQVKDVAGNTASYNTYFVIGNIDKDAPTGMTIGFAHDPFKIVAHFLTFGLFFGDTLDVTFSASDSLSGVDHYEYQTVAEGGKLSDDGWETGSLSISPDFKGTVYARAVDRMGNVSGYVTKSLVADKTVPVITLSSTSVVIVNKNATIPVSVCDEGAGVGSVSYQIGGGAEQTVDLTTNDYSSLTKTYTFHIDDLPNGIYDVVIHTQDNAGNTVSATVHVDGNSRYMQDNTTGVVVNASGTVFPANVTAIFLRCLPIAKNTAEFTMVSGLIGSGKEQSSTSDLKAFSLELIDQSGQPAAFTGKVTVKIPIPSGMSGDLHVYWYNDADGTVTDMNAKQENGYLVFETTHFSYYAVAELSGKSSSGSGTSSPNDTSSPASSSGAIPNPDTGNDSFPFLTAALVGSSMCGLGIVTRSRKFRKKKQQWR